MPDPTSLPATLRADPGVAGLVRSLALSSRFHFYLAIVEDPATARALASVLEHDVAAAREAPALVIRLDPYPAPPDRRGPVPWRRLVDEVLGRLLEPPAGPASPQAIVLVDASPAPAADDEAWRILFQRMNERRDTVATARSGSLILALPPRLEAAFAHAAPDFWSVRSLSVVVPSVHRPRSA